MDWPRAGCITHFTGAGKSSPCPAPDLFCPFRPEEGRRSQPQVPGSGDRVAAEQVRGGSAAACNPLGCGSRMRLQLQASRLRGAVGPKACRPAAGQLPTVWHPCPLAQRRAPHQRRAQVRPGRCGDQGAGHPGVSTAKNSHWLGFTGIMSHACMHAVCDHRRPTAPVPPPLRLPIPACSPPYQWLQQGRLCAVH